MFGAALGHRATAYRNLATMQDAGLDLVSSLGQSAQGLPAPLPKVYGKLAADLQSGADLFTAAKSQSFFSPLEYSALAVGEKSGNLPQVLFQLADWFDFRHRIVRLLWQKAAYPLFIVHLMALLGPLPALVTGGLGLGGYLLRVLLFLSWLYGPAFIVLGIRQAGQALPYWWDHLLVRLPLAGKGIETLSRHRFYRACHLGQRAGVELDACLVSALAACGNQVVKDQLQPALDALRSGQAASHGLQGVLPGPEWSIWQTGEESGTLEKSLESLSRKSEEEAMTRLSRAAKIAPWIFFFIVALVMINQIFTGFSRVLNPPEIPW